MEDRLYAENKNIYSGHETDSNGKTSHLSNYQSAQLPYTALLNRSM